MLLAVPHPPAAAPQTDHEARRTGGSQKRILMVVLVQSGLIVALLVHRSLRRRARLALAERLRFETLLSDVSATFTAGGPLSVDRDIEAGLRRMVEDLDVDRATLTALRDSSDEQRVTHAWTRAGITPLRDLIRGNPAPWIVSQLRQGRVVRLG